VSRPAGSIEETMVALGPGHPLARVERAVGWLRDQAWACAGIAVAAAVVVPVDRIGGLAVLGVSLLAEAVVWTVIGGYTLRRRRLIHDLFAAGCAPPLASVRAEAGRLLDPAHRRRLAGLLERALDEGERWYEFTPASRPPYGVRWLPEHAAAIHEIADGLRRPGATPRSVVLVERLMRGGYGSAIYERPGDWLGCELRRIRYELASAEAAASRSGGARNRAA
jgi:hypothetical protein